MKEKYEKEGKQKMKEKYEKEGKFKAQAKYKEAKQRAKEQNDLDQIYHTIEQCRKEMSQFRKYCCSVCHRMFRKKGVIKLTDNIKQQFKDKNLELTNKCLQYLS